MNYLCTMASTLTIDAAWPKDQKYRALIPQVEALFHGENHVVANMANLTAVLKEVFGHHWVGFYTVELDQLVLGPFQGPVACTRLFQGKGVCAAAWEQNRTVVVDDVDAFPGHIACSSLSRSEIVIPVRDGSGQVTAVLDIDSVELGAFDEVDSKGLQELVKLLEKTLG